MEKSNFDQDRSVASDNSGPTADETLPNSTANRDSRPVVNAHGQILNGPTLVNLQELIEGLLDKREARKRGSDNPDSGKAPHGKKRDHQSKSNFDLQVSLA